MASQVDELAKKAAGLKVARVPNTPQGWPAKKIRDTFVQRAGGARGVPRAPRATLAGPQVLRGPAAHALAVEQRRAARGPDAALRQRGHEPVQEHLPRLRAVSYIQMRESRLITHLFNPYLL